MNARTVQILLALPDTEQQTDVAAWLREEGYAVDRTTPDEVRSTEDSGRYHVLVLAAEEKDPAHCIATIQRLREMDPALAIIVQRNSGTPFPIAEALRAGADEVSHGITTEDDLDLLHLMILRSIVRRRITCEARARVQMMGAEDMHPLVKVAREASHDMSQPLTVIMGTVEMLLLDAPEHSLMREDLEMIQRETARLRGIAARLGSLTLECARRQ